MLLSATELACLRCNHFRYQPVAWTNSTL